MGKISATVLGAIVGGCAAAVATVLLLGWSTAGGGQSSLATSRADFVDFQLMLVTVLLAAIGLAVTVGAVVIGIVALKTLREIKDEAAVEAKSAAASKITETMQAELEPSVASQLKETLPGALRAALVSEDLGHQILSEMAQRGELDEVLERVANRVQGGGNEAEEPDEQGDE